MTNKQCIAKDAYSFTRCSRKVTTAGAEYCDEHLSVPETAAERDHLQRINTQLLDALEYLFASGQPLSTSAFLKKAELAIAKAKGDAK